MVLGSRSTPLIASGTAGTKQITTGVGKAPLLLRLMA